MSRGGKVGSEIFINGFAAGGQIKPQVATLVDGRVVVAWQDGSLVGDTSGYGIHFSVADTRGGVQSGPAYINVAGTTGSATDVTSLLGSTLANGTFSAGDYQSSK